MNRLPSTGDWPPGELRYVYLHWTAGAYGEVFDAYHFCAGLDEREQACVFATRDLRANMRDVRSATPGSYATHTAGHNSYAIGLAACGMLGATPHDFGRYPLRDDLLALVCATAARLCTFYAIAVDAEHVRTHAEAALEDGYFGAGPDERWDIARLRPSAQPLAAAEAREVGDLLRERVRRETLR
jgi:hypothetical protein